MSRQQACYDVTVRVPAANDARTVKLRIANRELEQPLAAGQDRVVYKGAIETGTCDIEARVESPAGVTGAHYVDLLKTD